MTFLIMMAPETLPNCCLCSDTCHPRTFDAGKFEFGTKCEHAWHVSCAVGLDMSKHCFQCLHNQWKEKSTNISVVCTDEQVRLLLRDQVFMNDSLPKRLSKLISMSESIQHPNEQYKGKYLASKNPKQNSKNFNLLWLFSHGITTIEKLRVAGVVWGHLRNIVSFPPSMLRIAYGLSGTGFLREFKIDIDKVSKLAYEIDDFAVLQISIFDLIKLCLLYTSPSPRD